MEKEANNLFKVESGPHRPLSRFYLFVKFPHMASAPRDTDTYTKAMVFKGRIVAVNADRRIEIMENPVYWQATNLNLKEYNTLRAMLRI